MIFIKNIIPFIPFFKIFEWPYLLFPAYEFRHSPNWKENSIVHNFGRIPLGVSARRPDISYMKK
jgi:hypothetical protein